MSISQTISNSQIPLQTVINTSTTKKVNLNDSTVVIPKSQAIKMVLDLEYLRLLKKQDSLLKSDTVRFSYISLQKDSLISALRGETITLNGVITNQVSQTALLNDVIKRTNAKTFWIKVERDALIVATIFLAGYAVTHH